MTTNRLASDVIVAICTHDRSEGAVTAAEHILAQAPSCPLVIVDSASSTEHAARLLDFAGSHPNVSIARCDAPGVARARNRAMTFAGGGWVAFVDDDVLVGDGWWGSVQRIVSTVPQTAGVVGGPILPLWPAAAPDHVGDRWLMFLSCLERRPADNFAGFPETYNGNLMLSFAAWEQAGGYPEDLGRVGTSLLSGEENELQHAVHGAGFRLLFDDGLLVHHVIPQERLTKEWIRKRAYWGGISEVVARGNRGSLPRRLNPVKCSVAMAVLWVASHVRDKGSDRYIRAHYARGVVAAQLPASLRPAV